MFILILIFADDNAKSNIDDITAPEPYITCDIIGSDAWCAAGCIAKGFRGGYCNAQKVCVCRH